MAFTLQGVFSVGIIIQQNKLERCGKRMRKAAKPFEFFFLRIAFFHLVHRILFLTLFRMGSEADFIELFTAITVIVNSGRLVVASKIIIHAYVQIKEKPTKSAIEIVGLIDLWFRAYQKV